MRNVGETPITKTHENDENSIGIEVKYQVCKSFRQ